MVAALRLYSVFLCILGSCPSPSVAEDAASPTAAPMMECPANSTSRCTAQGECGVINTECVGGWCMCQIGKCASNGICKEFENGCPVSTNTKCGTSGCSTLHWFLGPTDCVGGLCECRPGFCYNTIEHRCMKGLPTRPARLPLSAPPKVNHTDNTSAAPAIASDASNSDSVAAADEAAAKATLDQLKAMERRNSDMAAAHEAQVAWYQREMQLMLIRHNFQDQFFVVALVIALVLLITFVHVAKHLPLAMLHPKQDESVAPKTLRVPASNFPEASYEVIGAGSKVANGLYYLAPRTQAGSPYWLKKPVDGGAALMELSFCGGYWSIIAWPDGVTYGTGLSVVNGKTELYRHPEKFDSASLGAPSGEYERIGAGVAPNATVTLRNIVVPPSAKVWVTPGAVPSIITVRSPSGCGGTYVQVPPGTTGIPSQVNGAPIWKHETGLLFVFLGINQRWLVGDMAEAGMNFNCATGRLCSTDTWQGRMPNEMPTGGWQFFNEGGLGIFSEWEVDAEVRFLSIPTRGALSVRGGPPASSSTPSPLEEAQDLHLETIERNQVAKEAGGDDAVEDDVVGDGGNEAGGDDGAEDAEVGDGGSEAGSDDAVEDDEEVAAWDGGDTGAEVKGASGGKGGGGTFW